MFHVRYGELYLSVDAFSHSVSNNSVEDVFAAAPCPYGTQRDKTLTSKKGDRWGSQESR